MKDLLVIYDDQIKDKGRDSYLKAIKREIPSARIVNTYTLFHTNALVPRPDRILILKPIKDEDFKRSTMLFAANKLLDIEGIYTNRLTITAEAILRVIGEVENKTVIILNQSDVLGKPLAKELINRGANVFSINSSFDGIGWIYPYLAPDFLISASGDDDFKIKDKFLKYIYKIIDLSDDIDYENKITSIPTIEVLKDRLRWGGKNEYR